MTVLWKCVAILVGLTSWTNAFRHEGDTVLAGYHVIWSYSGPTIPQEIYDATKAGKVGGLIFFGENVSDDLPNQVDSLQTVYQKSNAYPGFPLIIVTDQEGGLVNRLPGGPTQSAKEVGQSTDPAAAAADAGRTVVEVFGKYSTNGDLAPVLDIFREPGDFIDEFQRSYGNKSELVSRCIGPFIQTLQSKGVVATAKHFPGLGAAGAGDNTDEQPVTIDLTLDEIRRVDEKPYYTAISNGIKMVMPSWAIYPALDSKYPSGLSREWIQQELRGRLGFGGVTISDALEAGSLTAFGGTGEVAVMAMSAGMDIVLASARNTTQGQQAVDTIESALSNRALDRRQFQQSTQRIVALRKSLKKRHSP